MKHHEDSPVLLLGYNRPEQLAGLIDALRSCRPSKVLLAVDGPKRGVQGDHELVAATQSAVDRIDWPAKIETRFRAENLGLRHAVVDAVNWATSEFGHVIVFEDDFRPGPDVVGYLNSSLKQYSTNSEIAHINGYNLVPVSELTFPMNQSRLSKYIESYAWATWEHQWKNYDDTLSWGTSVTISDLKEIVGSTAGALRWKINFADAATNRIDTWAYRWMSTIWSLRKFVISPNRNIGAYVGHHGGTHTRSRGYRDEPAIQQITHLRASLQPDARADVFISRAIFHEDVIGVLRGGVNSIILNSLRRLRSMDNSDSHFHFCRLRK